MPSPPVPEGRGVDTLVLDFDGPVLDGRDRHHACYAGILAEHGYAPLKPEPYWAMKRRMASRREQLAASGAEAVYDAFLAAWLERIERPEMLALDRVQPGAAKALRGWKAAGLRLVLATLRHSREGVHGQLARLGLDGVFEHVVVCDHRLGGAGKARAVRDALGEVDPPRLLWIGDTEADVEAARTLGCPVVLVTCGLRDEARVAALAPDRIAPDLSALAAGGTGLPSIHQ